MGILVIWQRFLSTLRWIAILIYQGWVVVFGCEPILVVIHRSLCAKSLRVCFLFASLMTNHLRRTHLQSLVMFLVTRTSFAPFYHTLSLNLLWRNVLLQLFPLIQIDRNRSQIALIFIQLTLYTLQHRYRQRFRLHEFVAFRVQVRFV